jgi:hypothetical protein
VVTLAVFGAVTPAAIRMFQAATTPLRIAVAIALLLPIGFLMGTALPLGMRAAATRASILTPWLWGINGATSVLASVLAVAISLHVGIAASFWAGVGCYAAATIALSRLGTVREAEETRVGLTPAQSDAS